MRALQLHQIGTNPTLTEQAIPAPDEGEVLIEIAACGLNFADTLMLDGRYQERPDMPFTMGMEVAGTILEHGPNTKAPAVGTRVAVRASQGGLAEAGVFPAATCVPLPDSVDFIDAAAFQIAYGTSHLALAHRAALRPGERLVVTGAAGGVGLTAVEIGHIMGAEVIAIARGKDKLAAARTAGAEHLIDAETPDLRGALKDLGGINVAYDTVGGALWDACFRAARPEARLLPIGFAGGEIPQIPANILLVKNLSVMGLYWGGYDRFAPDVLSGSLSVLMGWLAEGKLSPHVSHEIPLENAMEGFDLIRQRRSTGKVVVTMR